MTNADRKILVLAVIAAGMLTYRELRVEGRSLPRPVIYTGVAMVYGLAAITAEFTPDLAFWLAVGWTLAIAYRLMEQRRAAAERTA